MNRLSTFFAEHGLDLGAAALIALALIFARGIPYVVAGLAQ